MEPRARASRHKSSLNFPDELSLLLYGAGTPSHPDLGRRVPGPELQPPGTPTQPQIASSKSYLANLPSANRTHPPTSFASNSKELEVGKPLPAPYPETLRVLDEMVTDFVIETSQQALQIATYANRAKLKATDFEFVMRRDRKKLGRVQEMLRRKKKLDKDKKTAYGQGEGGQTESDLRKMMVADLQALGDIVGEEGTGKGRGKGRGRRKRRADEMEDADASRAPNDVERGGAIDEPIDEDVDLDNDLEEDEEPQVEKGQKRKAKRAKSEAQ